MNALLRVLLAIPLLTVFTAAAHSEEQSGGQPVAAKKPAGTDNASADEVQTLIEQLKSGKYAERNEAMKKLTAIGKPAVAAVTKAAHTDDLELGARCVDILKHFYKNGDAETKSAAEEALKTLRKTKHESVAQWAGEALRKNRLGNLPARGGINRNGIRIRIIGGGAIGRPRGFKREAKVTENGKTIHITETIAPGNRQIVIKITEKVQGKEKTTEIKAKNSIDLRRKNKAAYQLYRKHIRKAKLQVIGGNNPIRIRIPQVPAAPARRGGNISISSRTVNGKRTIDVNENGRKMQIRDNRGKDIVVKITETTNGKEKTTEYQAKDLAELQKKHPEAAKVYKRFAVGGGNGFGNIQIRAGFGGAPRRAAPGN